MPLTPQSPSTVAAVDTDASGARRATPPAGSGGWIVQLSAQKTEAEAQAAFRAAQAKYSALAGQQPLIRKKDQGETRRVLRDPGRPVPAARGSQ